VPAAVTRLVRDDRLPDVIDAEVRQVGPAGEVRQHLLGQRLRHAREQAELSPVVGDTLLGVARSPRKAERAQPHREPAVGRAEAKRPGRKAARLEGVQVQVPSAAGGQSLRRVLAEGRRHRPLGRPLGVAA
jgi:hypothetical protein